MNASIAFTPKRSTEAEDASLPRAKTVSPLSPQSTEGGKKCMSPQKLRVVTTSRKYQSITKAPQANSACPASILPMRRQSVSVFVGDIAASALVCMGRERLERKRKEEAPAPPSVDEEKDESENIKNYFHQLSLVDAYSVPHAALMLQRMGRGLFARMFAHRRQQSIKMHQARIHRSKHQRLAAKEDGDGAVGSEHEANRSSRVKTLNVTDTSLRYDDTICQGDDNEGQCGDDRVHGDHDEMTNDDESYMYPPHDETSIQTPKPRFKGRSGKENVINATDKAKQATSGVDVNKTEKTDHMREMHADDGEYSSNRCSPYRMAQRRREEQYRLKKSTMRPVDPFPDSPYRVAVVGGGNVQIKGGNRSLHFSVNSLKEMRSTHSTKKKPLSSPSGSPTRNASENTPNNGGSSTASLSRTIRLEEEDRVFITTLQHAAFESMVYRAARNKIAIQAMSAEKVYKKQLSEIEKKHRLAKRS